MFRGPFLRRIGSSIVTQSAIRRAEAGRGGRWQTGPDLLKVWILRSRTDLATLLPRKPHHTAMAGFFNNLFATSLPRCALSLG
jgi:hypothetical protein